MSAKLILADDSANPPLNITERSSAPSSPSSGDIYLDDGTNTGSTLPGFRRYTGAAWEDIVGDRPTQAIQTATTTIANTTTETTLFGTIGVGTLTISANALAVGDTIKLSLGGIISDTATPNINFRVKFGSTEIVSTGNIATSGSLSNDAWTLESTITVISIGASGTVFGTGMTIVDQSTAVHGLTNSSTPATAITVDTTAAITLNVTAQWDTASASNTITTHTANVRILR